MKIISTVASCKTQDLFLNRIICIVNGQPFYLKKKKRRIEEIRANKMVMEQESEAYGRRSRACSVPDVVSVICCWSSRGRTRWTLEETPMFPFWVSFEFIIIICLIWFGLISFILSFFLYFVSSFYTIWGIIVCFPNLTGKSTPLKRRWRGANPSE